MNHKRQQALSLIKLNPDFTRAQHIRHIMSTMNITEANAGYYYNVYQKGNTLNEMSVTVTNVDNLVTSPIAPDERFEAFKRRVQSVLALASQMYTLDLSQVIVKYSATGKSAGIAQMKTFAGGVKQCSISFNMDLMRRDYNHVYHHTIPHEIAHIVCILRPDLGKNHDMGWKQVCIMLGGNGKRCHNIDVSHLPRKRKATPHRYNCLHRTTGAVLGTMDLTERMHKNIVSGQVRICNRTKGFIMTKGYLGVVRYPK